MHVFESFFHCAQAELSRIQINQQIKLAYSLLNGSTFT